MHIVGLRECIGLQHPEIGQIRMVEINKSKQRERPSLPMNENWYLFRQCSTVSRPTSTIYVHFQCAFSAVDKGHILVVTPPHLRTSYNLFFLERGLLGVGNGCL